MKLRFDSRDKAMTSRFQPKAQKLNIICHRGKQSWRLLKQASRGLKTCAKRDQEGVVQIGMVAHGQVDVESSQYKSGAQSQIAIF